jgi:hypothetical protein
MLAIWRHYKIETWIVCFDVSQCLNKLLTFLTRCVCFSNNAHFVALHTSSYYTGRKGEGFSNVCPSLFLRLVMNHQALDLSIHHTPLYTS